MDIAQLLAEGRRLLDSEGLTGWVVRVGDCGRCLGLCLYREAVVMVDGWHLRNSPDEAVREYPSGELRRRPDCGVADNRTGRRPA